VVFAKPNRSAASASATSSRPMSVWRSTSGASGKNIGSRASAFACALPMNRYPNTPIFSGLVVIVGVPWWCGVYRGGVM